MIQRNRIVTRERKNPQALWTAVVLGDGERWTRRLAVAQTGLLLAALVTFAFGLGGTIQFGMPPMAVLAVALFTLAAVVGLGLPPTAVVAWARGWLTAGERAVLSVLALAAPVVLWWTVYWNVFGFRF